MDWTKIFSRSYDDLQEVVADNQTKIDGLTEDLQDFHQAGVDQQAEYDRIQAGASQVLADWANQQKSSNSWR